MRRVSRTSGSGLFAGVHFGLVSLKISLLVHVIFGSVLVPVFFSIHSCSLAVVFSHVPGLVFTFTCTRSSCSAESLFTALALPHTFALVE